MFGKKVKIFLKGQAKECYLNLKNRKDKEAGIILNSLKRMKNILQENPQYGNPLTRRLIPEDLLNLGIQNLYRVKLSNYWRLLYTIEGDRIIIFVFIIRILNHKDYNKLFGYKRS